MVVARVLSLAVLLGGSPPSVASVSGSGGMGIGWEMAGREEGAVVFGVERAPVRRMEPSLAARPERCFFNLNVLNVVHVYVRVRVCVFLCVSK
jgi:hypothetical protein